MEQYLNKNSKATIIGSIIYKNAGRFLEGLQNIEEKASHGRMSILWQKELLVFINITSRLIQRSHVSESGSKTWWVGGSKTLCFLFFLHRFNCGSGVTTLISETMVQIGVWHTVMISKNGRTGMLKLDNGTALISDAPVSLRPISHLSTLFPSHQLSHVESCGSFSMLYLCSCEISALEMGFQDMLPSHTS